MDTTIETHLARASVLLRTPLHDTFAPRYSLSGVSAYHIYFGIHLQHLVNTATYKQWLGVLLHPAKYIDVRQTAMDLHQHDTWKK
jgi:hypothetical protein